MNDHEMDKRLRSLFKEAGALHAPEGMETRVLHHIALLPKPTSVPEQPLLPKWTWYIAAFLAIGLLFFPGFDLRIPAVQFKAPLHWKGILSSQWLLMGVGAGVVLLGLDSWLNRGRSGQELR